MMMSRLNTVAMDALKLRNYALCMMGALLAMPVQANAANQSDQNNMANPAVTFSTSTDTQYLNGGIGIEEASAMRLKAAEFPLHMTLSQGKDGQYITGANVTIADKNGINVFELADVGPLLYVKLPQGAYKITADYNGVVLSKSISLGSNRGIIVYLNWKMSAKESEQEASKDSVMPGASVIAPE